MTAVAADPPATRRWSRPWLRAALLGAGALGAFVVLDGRLPDAGSVLAVATGADLRWAAVALLAQVVSQAMFGYQQRRLLYAFGIGISPRRALAVAVSRTAISMALPAGSAASAVFAAQQYRRRGATLGTASLVAVLSGVASVAGLLLLGLLGVALAQPIVLAGAAVLVAVIVPVRRLPGFSAPTGGAARALRRAAALIRKRRPRRAEPVAAKARRVRAVPVRHWAAAIAFAAASWLLDLTCLAAAAAACHVTVGHLELGGIYLAAQVARQLPLTPGGIGLIETSLLTGLLAAGAAQPGAAAVVLGYRLVSCWLILPFGAATYLGLRRLPPDRALRADLSGHSPASLPGRRGYPSSDQQQEGH